MTTDADVIAIIRKNKHNPVRRAYIKRRLYDGTYETNWQRIDSINGRDRVLEWGSISIEIDNQPGEIAKFDVSGLRMVMDNSEGFFDVEYAENSLWYPSWTYLNRRYTKIKIDCGYYDQDGNEIGVVTIFEGFINKVTITEEYKANLEILSYQGILAKYSIKDLNLTGLMLVSAIINAIMNQTKITTYVPYVASTPVNDVYIADASTLDGTYWDVIQDLAYKSASVPYLNCASFTFIPRTMSVSSVYDFKGEGADNDPDVYKVASYDDEGADRVRVYFTEKGTSLYAISGNSLLLRKYLGDPEEVDLANIDADSKPGVLQQLVNEWQNPRPVIEFVSRFLLNYVEPLDQITLEILGPIDNQTGVARFDIDKFDDDTMVYGKAWGGIYITTSAQWMITKVTKDIGSWSCTIKAERRN